MAIIYSELNDHQVSLGLARKAAVMGIILMKDLFLVGDKYLIS